MPALVYFMTRWSNHSNQALAENSEDVGILDNRAATYCSLKQYGQARTDARNMIKLAPNDDRVSIRFYTLSNILHAEWLSQYLPRQISTLTF